MPCPVCSKPIEGDVDHRVCVFTLFKENAIQSVEEWEKMAAKPTTVVKGRVRIRITKD